MSATTEYSPTFSSLTGHPVISGTLSQGCKSHLTFPWPQTAGNSAPGLGPFLVPLPSPFHSAHSECEIKDATGCVCLQPSFQPQSDALEVQAAAALGTCSWSCSSHLRIIHQLDPHKRPGKSTFSTFISSQLLSRFPLPRPTRAAIHCEAQTIGVCSLTRAKT